MADHAHPHLVEENPQVHHEASDVNIRAVFGFGAGLIVVAGIIHFLVWLLFLYFSGREAVRTPRQFPLAATEQQQLPPEPRLQITPRQDLKDLRAAEDNVLNGYGWIDRNASVVHIPIDAAMKRVVEQGLPSRPPNRGGR
jgi:hypothetical protein